MSPSSARLIEDEINKFLVPLTRAGRTEYTVHTYFMMLRRDLNWLHSKGMASTHKSIGAAEVEALIAERWVNAPKYNHNRRSLMKQFLEYHGNRVFDEYPEPANNSMRINVDWLSDQEAVSVYNACNDPTEKLIIHMELRLALRRFDLLHVQISDVMIDHMNVLGKGNKKRTVPYCNDTLVVFREYMKIRDKYTDCVRDPDSSFLLIKRYPEMPAKTPGKTFVDNIVKSVSTRAGIERNISNHTLRRTCARMWYRAGVPLATVSALLGHTDVKTTIRYLGLTMDDLNAGASLYDQYFDGLQRVQPTPNLGQNLGIARQNGGQGEI